MLAFIAILCALLLAVIAAPTDVASLDRRATVIADGNSVRNGNLPDWGFNYHASGYVAKGCPTGTKITTCYESRLSSNPTKNIENIGGRKIQSNLFYSSPKPADGRIREYTFKMKVDASFTSTSDKPHTLVGVETQDLNNNKKRMISTYVAIRNGEVGIYTYANPDTPLISTPMGNFIGKRALCTWKVNSDSSKGWVDITIVNDEDSSNILSYTVSDGMTWGNYRMRVGTTREAVAAMSQLRIFWGSWSGKYIM
ncbi:hypothetical protein RhiLY_12553 [Ceratobasidium sp. AG-Ba]|nr:hypothetical protein RhiLY_12553 [Ceratobasidium sp. AG-Ba]